MRPFFCLFSVSLLIAGAVLPLSAQPVINEFMASSLTVYPDNSDFDDYSDWIELFNPTGTNVSLKNHFLTDDLAQPFKWLIPSNAVVPANGYLMFRADGFDAAPGETRIRGYWPWGSTFETRRFHTGFKLSADGEAIGLYKTLLPPQDVTLISSGATWKYLDQGTNPPVGWTEPAFDDVEWPQGFAQLGYGDADENTAIGYGPSSTSKYPTAHFRHQFTVTDPVRLGNIRFRANVDDGAVFYLNGTEFARLRMPTGTIRHTNYANAQPPIENTFESIELPRSLFVAGQNVLAVEVHQVSANSSDLSFDVELIAAEITGAAILVDSVTFGPQTTDVSYGRNAAATNGWSFFGCPTPEAPNSTEALTQLTAAPDVTASLPSGFYSGAQSVNLASAGFGVTIRYTLDGSIPGVASEIYSGSLAVPTNTILRARAFQAGLIPSPILTRSYFVNEATDRTLPVLSFVADPATLTDPIIGIYTNDTQYPYKGREFPVRVEFFETNGSSAFAVNSGARIGGENIWRFAQKPLNLHMRGKYGDDIIPYPMFPGEPVATFGKLNVRNGGDNWHKDMLRDAFMAPVLRGQSENDVSSYRPCVVFLNGRYWGIHDIRKQFDPVFFANEHQLVEDTYDLVQYAHNENGVTTLMADTGNIDSYENFHAFYTTHNPSQPTNYAAILAQMNVDSFIDYVVANDFGVNTSWGHNREFWCAREPGSKWQWNVPDFDRCFDSSNLQGSLIDDFRSSYPLFQALDNNTNFVNRLLQRYAAHLGSTLHSNRISSILDRLSAEVDGEMPRHIARWASEGGIPSLATRQAELSEIKQFAVGRPTYAVSRLQTELGLNLGQASLTVTVLPAAGGSVRIAGVPMTPEFNTTIGLFKNTPVEITADPAPGYTFVSWSNGNTNPAITLVLNANESLTAHFQTGAETVLPGTISADITLTSANSPYSVTNDLIVAPNVTLTVGPGVTFLMPPSLGIRVYGSLQVNGTSNAPVEMRPRSGPSWGNLSFVNATGPSVLSHLKIRRTSPSRFDPVNLKAAVSGWNSTITLDHVDIEATLPIFTRFGSTTLRDSRIHVLFTGDGINVKSGNGLVEDCTFTGMPTPDTDAIDFDNVPNGMIRGNRIYAFRGFNSDAIDIGEGCTDLQVTSNRIFNITDKGISVGQASTARIQRNLIVDCAMGIGVKDFGSTAHINQNTFARNDVDVAAYEKNLGNGGGIAWITNCIFYRSKDAPVTVDALSSLTIRYSLSDTLPLAGTGNLLADPKFTDAGSYDFSLAAGSPAINTGDPDQPADADASRSDMGAYYAYDPADYPYLVPNLVVVNEVLAHSHDAEADWIELHNNSAQDVDLSGWYLSDDADNPMKFRIADGTILPASGYLVFDEHSAFGLTSTNAGALIPFALSESGDTVNVFGPSDGLRPDYSEKEDFGPSATGVTFGRHYKSSTRTYNFVAMTSPTPNAANSLPLTGPVVISEIMYHPPVADAEYLELANITTNSVTLLDSVTGVPWQITKGVTHVFPTTPPLTLAAREKILLVRNSTFFNASYTAPTNTRIFQWTSGGLDNNGETVELSKPGDVNNLGERQYIRVDRIDYTDASPWPTGPDGSGTSLVRIDERSYGNDVANWAESSPTPGQTSFQQWLSGQSLPIGEDGPNDDPDDDGFCTAMEYGLGTDALIPSDIAWRLETVDNATEISFSLQAHRTDVGYVIQKATDNSLTQWAELNSSVSDVGNNSFELSTLDPEPNSQAFYRLVLYLYNY